MLKPGRLRLQADVAGTLLNASHEVEADQLERATGAAPDHHDQDFLMLDLNLWASLALSERFAIELMQPFRMVHVDASFREDGRLVPGFESVHHRDETLLGPGDPDVGVRYRLLAPSLGKPTRLDVRLGVNLPLGRTEDNPFERGRQMLEHQHIQFGTGTFDPYAGIDLVHGFGDFALSSWASGRTALYDNSHGFRSGLRVGAGVSIGSGFDLEGWMFQVGPEIYHEQPSTWENGEESVNSGRTDITAAAGVFWAPSADFGFHALVKKPFTVHAEGGQLQIPLVALVGVQGGFDLWSEEDGHDHGAHDHGDHDHGDHDHGDHDHGDHDAHDHGAHERDAHDHDAHDDDAHEGPAAAGAGDVADIARDGRSFEVGQALVPGKITVIDFWAEWCEPCHAIDRMLRALAARHPNLAVRRAEVVDLDSPVAIDHLSDADALPVIWVFDERGERVETLNATTLENVESRLKRLLTPGRRAE